MARGAVMGYRGAMPSATFDTHDAVAEGVATKADLRAELAALETRLTIRMAAFVLAGAGLTIALLQAAIAGCAGGAAGRCWRARQDSNLRPP